MRNPFEASKGVAYPAVPATWPNRAVRRAVRHNRRLPQVWAAFFAMNPKLRDLVRTGRLA